MSLQVGLGTSSRIWRTSPALFVLSRIFAVTCALFGYSRVNLHNINHFGHFWTDFEYLLTVFISRFSLNGSCAL